MIEIDGKIFLNLEEAVQYNKELIKKIQETSKLLETVGIRVVGYVAKASELPDPATYTGNYGDAYAVGETTPYKLHIFTRPFEGQSSPTWFNIGPFPLPGPKGNKGDQGDKGDQGPMGSIWYSGNENPTKEPYTRKDDMYLKNITGEVFQFDGTAWNRVANIRGPQGIPGPTGPVGPQGPVGPVGPQGDKGLPGDPFTIIARLNTPDQLPTPTEAIREDAYIIDISGTDYLYYIVGQTGGALTWARSQWTGARGPQGPVGPQGPQGNKGDKGDTGAVGPAGSIATINLPTGQGNISRENMDLIVANPYKYAIKIEDSNLFFKLSKIENNFYNYSAIEVNKPEDNKITNHTLSINAGGLAYDTSEVITQSYVDTDNNIDTRAKVNANNLNPENVLAWKNKLINTIANDLYPVGCTRMFNNNADHSNDFGFTWVKIGSDRALWLDGNGKTPGSLVDAGLPNITGKVGESDGSYWGWGHLDALPDNFTGAFTMGSVGGHSSSQADSEGLVRNILFDASKSNALYGASNTVQPNAYVVAAWVRVG